MPDDTAAPTPRGGAASAPAPATTAYRVLTPRLVLRCYDPSDAAALVDAMTAGTEHLLPWLPWAVDEPQSLDEKVALLRSFRAKFDRDEDFVYGAFERAPAAGAAPRLVGGTGIHLRIGAGAGEIGYWLRAGEVGKGLATEMAAAMTCVGFGVRRFRRMAIHCDSGNVRSAAIPPRLGYRPEGVLRGAAVLAHEARGDLQVFGMTAAEFPASPAARVPIAAFDAAGRPIAV